MMLAQLQSFASNLLVYLRYCSRHGIACIAWLALAQSRYVHVHHIWHLSMIWLNSSIAHHISAQLHSTSMHSTRTLPEFAAHANTLPSPITSLEAATDMRAQQGFCLNMMKTLSSAQVNVYVTMLTIPFCVDQLPGVTMAYY